MQIETALLEAGSELPRLPEVYVPSPSANEFHDLYHKGGVDWGLRKSYLELGGITKEGGTGGYRDRMPAAINDFLDALKAREMGLSGFRNPTSLAAAARHSLAGNIVLTTSGMISEAFSEELFKPLVQLDTTAVFLVGYQDPQSTGGKLKAAEIEGKKYLEIDGAEIEIKAAIEKFSGFSGHGNALEIDEWLAGQNRNSRVFLVHGESGSLNSRNRDLAAQGWQSVTIPQHGERFSI